MRIIDMAIEDSIDLGDGIMVKIVEVPRRERRGKRSRVTGKLRIGIAAPRSVPIVRGEIHPGRKEVA